MNTNDRREARVQKRGKPSWRERLGGVLVKTPPTVAALSLAGWHKLVRQMTSAMLRRMVAAIPKNSPGDAFAAEAEVGILLLE